MSKRLGIAFILLFSTFVAIGDSAVKAAEYYLSANGNDRYSGLSPSTPWKTLKRINRVTLRAGDRVFLEAGDVFSGRLELDKNDIGTAANPIQISSYGEGRATISAGTGTGIWAYNTAGIRISNLLIQGSGWNSSGGSGVFFYTDLAKVKLDTVIIEGVEAVGFKNGVEIGAWNGTSGYKNIRIVRTTARDNRENGITVWGYDAAGHTGYAHQNLYIGYSKAFRNSGTYSAGNGIVVSNVNGGVIERSVAHHNGFRNTTRRGPVGIWAWRSTRIAIQYNESYGNRAIVGGVDGGGFDLDGGVTSSIMQYNYSHDNDGAGYLLAQYKSAQPFYSNYVRFNISENDGRRNGYSGIQVWAYTDGGIRNTGIFNNTIYTGSAYSGVPSGIRVVSKTVAVTIRNNAIVSTSGGALLNVVPGQIDMKVQGNAYWARSEPFKIRWANVNFRSLQAFRSTGQEYLDGKPVGLSADPRFVSEGIGVTFNDARLLEGLTAYRLTKSSPLLDQGLNLGSALGNRDYFGFPLSAERVAVGAYGGWGELVTADVR